MRKSLRIFFIYYFPLLVWMGIIFALSAMTGSPRHGHLELYELLFRKSAHVMEYFVLTLLFFRLIWRYAFGFFGKAGLSATLFALAYAVSDEMHQLFVLYREGKPSDVGIDLIGIALAMSCIYILYRADKHARR